MDLKTTYTLMPLSRFAHEPISRRIQNPSETQEHCSYPFNSFPPLECHVSPPLAVINGGPKLADIDLDAISLSYHRQDNETQIATKERLALLSSIWGLFMGAKDLAKEWENENRRKKLKRKRDQDDDDVARPLQRQRTDRTTRPIPTSEPTRQATGGTPPKEISRTRKRDWETMSS